MIEYAAKFDVLSGYYGIVNVATDNFVSKPIYTKRADAERYADTLNARTENPADYF